MSKKRKTGRCIHCLKISDTITDDHVIPKSWYPANTPEQIQRPTAPSCESCNSSLGAIEQEVGILMWVCIDPSKPQAQGLRNKAMKSLGIGVSGLSSDEKRHRERLKRKIFSSAKRYNPSGITKPFPGFGPHKGFDASQQISINFPYDKLNKVAEKVIRGIEWRQRGEERYIEDPYKIEIFYPDENRLPDVMSMMDKLPVKQHGPGFEIKRGASTEDKSEILYRIEIWGTWVVYAHISSRTIS